MAEVTEFWKAGSKTVVHCTYFISHSSEVEWDGFFLFFFLFFISPNTSSLTYRNINVPGEKLSETDENHGVASISHENTVTGFLRFPVWVFLLLLIYFLSDKL